MQGVVFDLDGVLVDSKENMRDAWTKVCSTFELDVPFGDFFKLIGRPLPNILSDLGILKSIPEIVELYAASSSGSLDEVPLFDGVSELLADLFLDDIPIALVTSKDLGRTSRLLERHAIKFHVVLTPECGLPGKPNPDQLLKVAKLLDIGPENLFYVGDMPVDLEAAESAGFKYVHCSWGYGPRELGKLNFSSPQSLQKYLGHVLERGQER